MKCDVAMINDGLKYVLLHSWYIYFIRKIQITHDTNEALQDSSLFHAHNQPGLSGVECDCDVLSSADSQIVSVGTCLRHYLWQHYNDVIMGTVVSQVTSLTIVYSTIYSDADQRKHQSSTSLAFVQGIHRGPVNYPHKWPVTRKMFSFDDVIIVMSGPGPLFMSYWQISWSLEATRLYVTMAITLWNLIGILAVLLTGACRISELLERSKSHSFETLGDLAVRHLTA